MLVVQAAFAVYEPNGAYGPPTGPISTVIVSVPEVADFLWANESVTSEFGVAVKFWKTVVEPELFTFMYWFPEEALVFQNSTLGELTAVDFQQGELAFPTKIEVEVPLKVWASSKSELHNKLAFETVTV